MKILHIEDDTRISTLAKAVFMRTSHDFLLCHSPHQASAILSEYDIDLVILDLVFPDNETGVQILEKIHKEDLPTKVIIFSGFASSHFESQLTFYKNLNIIISVHTKPGNFSKIVEEIEVFGSHLR